MKRWIQMIKYKKWKKHKCKVRISYFAFFRIPFLEKIAKFMHKKCGNYQFHINKKCDMGEGICLSEKYMTKCLNGKISAVMPESPSGNKGIGPGPQI